MLRPPLLLAAILTAATSIVGCEPDKNTNTPESGGSATKGEPFVFDEPFPSRERTRELVAQVEASPYEGRTFEHPVADVDQWMPIGERPSEQWERPYDGDDPVGQAVAERFAEQPNGQRSSYGLQCLAEQVGRFMVANSAKPSASVFEFLSAWCGVTAGKLSFQLVQPANKDLPASWSKPKVYVPALKQLPELLPDDMLVGYWRGKTEAGGIEVLIMGQPTLQLVEPIGSKLGEGSTVEFSVETSDQLVTAFASRGAIDAVECDVLRGSDEARRRIRCPADRKSGHTLVEVVTSPHLAATPRVALRSLVTSDATAVGYTKVPLPSFEASGDEARDLLAVANALREQLGREPLTVVEPQSQTMASLAPAMATWLRIDDFNKAGTHEPYWALLAGWDVPERIQGTTMRWTSDDLRRPFPTMLSAWLTSPVRRHSLLADDRTLAAITVRHFDERERVMGIGTFSQIEDGDHTESITTLFDAIDRRRVASGLPPLTRVQGEKDVARMEQAATAVRDDAIHPNDAFRPLAMTFSKETGRPFNVQPVIVPRLDDLDFDFTGPLVESPNVAAIATITHAKPESAAWARYVIVILFTEL